VHYELPIHRGEVPLDKNTFVLKLNHAITKPELRTVLQKLYGLEIK
jgi:ribosomal protein L23